MGGKKRSGKKLFANSVKTQHFLVLGLPTGELACVMARAVSLIYQARPHFVENSTPPRHSASATVRPLTKMSQ